MLAVAIPWFNDAKSAPESSQIKNNGAAAQAEFAKDSWDKAIPLYRKHLRSFPTDYQAWNRLAASYYHSGQVKQALETLQRIQRNSPDRSFNFFYQGMCVAVLGSEQNAVKYWEYAANWQDEYGAHATFEIAVSAYRAGDEERARKWLGTYTQKFPRGPNAQAAKDLIKSLSDGKKIDPVKGFDRPDPEITVYKYHPWSLFKIPHFWQVQVGYDYGSTTGYEPAGTGTIQQRVEVDAALVVNASIGVGPVRNKNATSYAGYTYKQNWYSEPDAFPLWLANGLSLDSFPLRGDMMERAHQFFGDVRRQVGDNLFLGAYARLEYSRTGSSFFPSPDDSNLKIVTPDVDTQLLIPWMGWTWSQTSRSMLSLYLRKELHNQSPEHSNKTFDITGSTGQPAMSFTLSHAVDFPSKKVETNFDLFQYEFIFNDYWLDYSRLGGLASVDYEIYKGIGAAALIGYYQDKYKLPHIKTGSCATSPSTDSPSTTTELPHVTCPRTDSGNMMQLTVYYNKTPNLRFDFSYLMVENSSNIKVYSESKSSFRANVTWAFPGTKRVSRMTERFADAAFTKDSDQ
jgi:tetratricopeptide (TPR) repeat protein